MELSDTDTDTDDFIAHDWIGVGKVFSDSLPNFVLRAKRERLTIPSQFSTSPHWQAPDPSISVSKFVDYPLPRISSEIIATKVSCWFSPEPPGIGVTESLIFERSVPSKDFVLKLKEAVGQAWLDGTKSIIDHRFNDGRDHLPLWMITLWLWVHDLTELQSTWRKSLKWLNHQASTPQGKHCTSIATAQEIIRNELPWDSKMKFCRNMAQTSVLARFLGTTWINDENINMMVEDLASKVQDSPDTRILGLSFAFAVRQFVETPALQGREKGVLHGIESAIKNDGLKKIYFPLHVSQTHWVAGEINFPCRTFTFGDSLLAYGTGQGGPVKFVTYLQKWLKSVFGRRFRNRGNTLPHAIQDDSFSCGIITLNTLAHSLNGEPLWRKEHACKERVRWFNRLAASAIASQSSTAPIQDSRFKLSNLLNPESKPNDTSPDYDDSDTSSANTSDEDQKPDFEAVNRLHTCSSNAHQVRPDNESDTVSMFARSDQVSLPDSSIYYASSHLPSPEAPSVHWPSGPSSPQASSTDWPSGPPSLEAPTPGWLSGPPSPRSSAPDWPSRPPSPEVSSSNLAMEPPDQDNSGSSKSKPKSSWFRSIIPNTKKRARSESSSDYNGCSSDSSASAEVRKPATKYVKAGDGKSRSAMASLKRRELLRSGELKVDKGAYQKWKKKVLSEDRHATFDNDDPRRVQHSKCGKWILMKDPCDVTRFKEHLPKCPKRAEKGRVGTLFGFGFGKNEKKPAKEQSPEPAQEPMPQGPCPGLTPTDDPKIKTYLNRTAVGGGGGRAVTSISKAIFGALFGKLSNRKQKQVLDTQHHEWKWTNDHINVRVFSTSCEKAVPNRSPRPAQPCHECFSLLRNRGFKAVLRKKQPKEENYKHVNKQFRPKLLGEIYARTIGVRELVEEDARSSPCVRYAQGALSGKYNNDVFNGLVQAIVTKEEKEERGVGMQNFPFAPAWEEMCHIMHIHSPRAYKSLREYFPMPNPRTLRRKEGRQPRFPMYICAQTFKLVTDHLRALNYSGPVGLSCDDTKLFATFRLYWDAEQQAHFLIGGIDGPIRVADPEKVKEAIDAAKDRKATKVRLWCLTIPAPKVAPIIVAAVPISNSMDAPALLDLHMQVLDGLINAKVMVVSYACDGTEVERSVQRMFLEKCEKCEIKVKDPRPGYGSLVFVFGKYRGQAICIIQDSKHALKTLRNNLFSGARLLILGNFTPMFRHILEIVLEDGSPLFTRDVIKLDRQDDNAAVRLFSADTLRFLADNHPEYVGDIAYLFVFGELVDAYQNRRISHHERVEMVLRARFFLDTWEEYLTTCQYRRDRYFISREANDILRILIDGFMSLVIIHRDHMPDGQAVPLLPWLHSSEANEHVFGEGRKVTKDFTYLDFIYMIPKLRIKLHEAVLRGKASSGKDRAAGYSHTYFDHEGLDIANLSTFPSDVEIEEIAVRALQQSDSISELVGINVDRLRNGQRQPVLPNISSLFDAELDGLALDQEEADDQDKLQGKSELEELQEVLDREEESPISREARTDDRCMALTSAAIALVVDEVSKVNKFASVTDEELDEVDASEFAHLSDIAAQLPSLRLNIPDERTNPMGYGTLHTNDLDFEALVDMRRRHQTKQAASGVRKQSTAPQKPQLRYQVLQEFHSALRSAQDDTAVGTGVERGVRWRAPATGGRDGLIGGVRPIEPDAGTAANAAVTAAGAAKKAATRRNTVFTKAGVPNLLELSTGRVSSFRPIQVHDHGFIMTDNGIMLARAIGLYSKSGGKNGKHSDVTESSNIAAISYMPIQVFQQHVGRNFGEVTSLTALLQTKQFLLLPSTQFLCLLDSSPNTRGGSGVEISVADLARFRALKVGEAKIREAFKLFSKRSVAQDENED